MRATVYMLGESQNPRWDELKTSVVVGTVALGIGLGSPLAGWLSGRKVELGLIPIGAVGHDPRLRPGRADSLGYIPGLVACTILIGFCTGFYLVPLFTLLQYRAPKTSKGDMIATSNFINVTGAIVASLLFAGGGGRVQGGRVPARDPGPTDRVAEGTLDDVGLLRGRPVYVPGRRPDRRPPRRPRTSSGSTCPNHAVRVATEARSAGGHRDRPGGAGRATRWSSAGTGSGT